MKRRLALLWSPLLFAVALALPGTTAAASGYTFKVENQHCISGGHNVYFRVSATAAGSTPATKLTIKSTSQYLSGGTWHSSYHWKANKTSFTPNGQAHTIDYSYTHENDTGSVKWRIQSVLKAYQGKHVLAQKTLTSKAC